MTSDIILQHKYFESYRDDNYRPKLRVTQFQVQRLNNCRNLERISYQYSPRRSQIPKK